MKGKKDETLKKKQSMEFTSVSHNYYLSEGNVMEMFISNSYNNVHFVGKL